MPKVSTAPPIIHPFPRAVVGESISPSSKLSLGGGNEILAPKRGEIWKIKPSIDSSIAPLVVVISADGIGCKDFRQVAPVLLGKVGPMEVAHFVPVELRPCTNLTGDYFIDTFLTRLLSLNTFTEKIGSMGADNLTDVNETLKMVFCGC
ncbi:MAG TPA: hypothetical protein VF627_11945 [Abditibacterium sp.]|jgi:hypothetical protein